MREGGITRQGPLSVEGHQWPAWFRNGQRLALYPSARWRWLDCPPRRLQPLHAAGITLQNAGFAAFFETGGEGGHSYVDCRVSPGPKPAGATEEQLVGCGADGFHSASTRIGPTIQRCAWEGLLHDDCIAIHGSLQQILRAEGNKLILEKGNHGNFAVGEPVRISSQNGFFGEFTCTSLRVLENKGGLLELTLDRESAHRRKRKRRIHGITVLVSKSSTANWETVARVEFWSKRITV